MRRHRAVAAWAGVVVLLWAGGPVLTPEVSAQVPKILEGVYLPDRYQRKSETGDWKDGSPTDFEHIQKLYIRQDMTYHWGDYFGEYRILPSGRVRLCGREAEAMLPASLATHVTSLTFETIATSGQGMLGHRYGMKYDPQQRDFPQGDDPRDKLSCQGAQGRPNGAPLVARLPGGVPGVALQAPAPSVRAINGEILFALYADAPAADRQLWSCVATQGAASVQFTEAGSPNRQSVYVWPDGRFRTRLSAGTTYHWRMLTSSACGAAVEQQADSVLQVPPPHAPVDEKAVLACFVSQGRFDACQGWWLQRP